MTDSMIQGLGLVTLPYRVEKSAFVGKDERPEWEKQMATHLPEAVVRVDKAVGVDKIEVVAIECLTEGDQVFVSDQPAVFKSYELDGQVSVEMGDNIEFYPEAEVTKGE